MLHAPVLWSRRQPVALRHSFEVTDQHELGGNPEQAWHEAYRDIPYQGMYERTWFGVWWLRDEFTP